MKISVDKNLAYSDQPTPMTFQEVQKRLKPRNAQKRERTLPAELRFLLPTSGAPKFEPSIERVGRAHELAFQIENWQPGQHVFPPPIETKQLRMLGKKSKAKLSKPLETESFIPDYLPLRPIPRALPTNLRRPSFTQVDLVTPPDKSGNRATTIFSPDDRFVFNDTSYPWSTCGRVDIPGGLASGVMVGPRHMLTVSHAIQWNSDGTAGWVRFRPSFFDGSAPFGEAWGTRVYFKYKVTGPTIDWIEGMYDYVVVVLNWRIGNLTGWMGSRGYTDSWDGGLYWSHIGYPVDLTAGNRPIFQSSISLDGAWWQFDSHESMSHHGDVWPGQSGGPFFGWWTGEVGPRVVAAQSSQSSGDNYSSGGQDMVDLIIRAQNENP